MAAQLVDAFLDALLSTYGIVSTFDVRIPYVYTSIAASDVSNKLTETTSIGMSSSVTKYTAFNTRRLPVMEATIYKSDDNPVSSSNVLRVSLSLTLYLYDLLQAQNPAKNIWDYGVSRGAFVFADQPVATATLFFSNDSTTDTPAFKFQGGGTQRVELYNYDTKTGAQLSKILLEMLGDDAVIDSIPGLLTELVSRESSFTKDAAYFNLSDELGHLEVNKSKTVTTYTKVTSTSHSATTVISRWDATKYEQGTTTVRTEPVPIPRLPAVSAIDTSQWSKYPLGSSPQECVARLLKIPFNNKYYVTNTGDAGVLQIIEAVDTTFAANYSADVANAGVAFSDLRTVYQAVVGYIPAIAAEICSAKSLPRAVIPVLVAKIEYHFFMTESLHTDITTAMTKLMPYIALSNSINDTPAKLLEYFNKYRSFQSYYGSYYTTVTGRAIDQLGVSAVNVGKVLSECRRFQLIFNEAAVTNAINTLAGSYSTSGALQVLNHELDVYPRLAIQAYYGRTNSKVICTGQSLFLDSGGRITRTINVAKVLEVS